MGLEDFTEDKLSDEHKERREKLGRNTPPNNQRKWRHFEPGKPEWSPDIFSEVTDEGVLVIAKSGTGEDGDAEVRAKTYIELRKRR